MYGERLSHPASYKIETPTVSVERVLPQLHIVSPYGTFAVLFNQYVDQSAVLKTVSIIVNKKTFPIRLRLVPRNKALQKVPELRQFAHYEGKWLLFETEDLLPPNTAFELKIGPNVRSTLAHSVCLY